MRTWQPPTIAIAVVLATAGCASRTIAPIGNAAPPRLQHQRIIDGGIAVDFALRTTSGDRGITAAAGQTVDAEIAIHDARSGAPLRGAHPRAWIARGRTAAKACPQRIRGLASGAFSTRADIDLNAFRMLTLNDDNTIAFFDPLVAFDGSKLEHLITLPARGFDWAIEDDDRTLYVSMPDADRVAVIDLATRAIVRTIDTGAGSRPAQLLADAHARDVWVALDGMGRIAALDRVRGVVQATIDVGGGAHELALTADGAALVATSGEARTANVIDTATRTLAARIALEGVPRALAYDAASDLMYIGTHAGLIAIDLARHRVASRMPEVRDVAALAFERGGRIGLAASDADDSVTAFDTATRRVIGRSTVVAHPDQLRLTERFAYVRGLHSENFSMIDLAHVRAGTMSVATIVAGRTSPDRQAGADGDRAMVATTPDDAAVMIANPADRSVAYYQEGMMATSGSLSTDGRVPRGILIWNRSLREHDRGRYVASVTLPRAGTFDVPVFVESPRVLTCFTLRVGADAATLADTRVQPQVTWLPNQHATARTRAELRVRVVDRRTQRALSTLAHVNMLTFMPPGVWTRHLTTRNEGHGVYVAETNYPRAGAYDVLVGVPDFGEGYAAFPHLEIRVTAR